MIILKPGLYSAFLQLVTGIEGPRLPSMFFCLVGSAIGAVSYYESCISNELDALNKYPELMVLHVRDNYPLDVMHSFSEG